MRWIGWGELLIDLARGSQCLGGLVQARGDLPHHFDANLRKLRDQVEKPILRQAQGLQVAMRDHRRGAWHVAQDRDLADDGLAERVDLDRTFGTIDQNVGLTVEDDVDSVAVVALMEQLVAERDCSRSLVNASSFNFAGSSLANSGIFRRTSRSLVKVMVDLLLVCRTVPSRSVSTCLTPLLGLC